MNIADAQQEMRFAYFGGGPGMLVSALVWLTAGMVALTPTPKAAVLALLVGGMLIHPIATVMAKALGRPAAHGKDNVLGTLAIEGTFWLVFSLPLTYGLSLVKVEWFFPAMLLVIGGRYLTFATLFGTRLYWLCGFSLAFAGFLLEYLHAPFVFGPFAGAAIELAFTPFAFAAGRASASGGVPAVGAREEPKAG